MSALWLAVSGLAWGQAARISGTPSTTCDFPTVDAAVAAAGPGDEIVVNSTLVHTVSAELVVDHALTVRGGSGTCDPTGVRAELSGGFANRVFRVAAGGDLTLEDLNLLHGDPAFSLLDDSAGGLVKVEYLGQLQANKVDFRFGSATAGGCLSVTGVAQLTDVVFAHCEAYQFGGAVVVAIDNEAIAAGQLSAVNTTLEGAAPWGGCLAVAVGAGLGLPRPSAELVSSTLQSCTADGVPGAYPGIGGGAWVRAGDLLMSGTAVNGNAALPAAEGAGGGLYVDDEAQVEVGGGSVTANTAAFGGGAYVTGSGVLELDGTCVGCTMTGFDLGSALPAGNAAQVGGGVAVASGGTLQVFGTTLIGGNVADFSGGGVDASGEGSSAWLNDASMVGLDRDAYTDVSELGKVGAAEACDPSGLGNVAQRGGGLAVRAGARLTVEPVGRRFRTIRLDRTSPTWSVRVACNFAEVGGGLLVEGATSVLDLKRMVVVANGATAGGGGLMVGDGADAYLTSSSVLWNDSAGTIGGGGAWVDGAGSLLSLSGQPTDPTEGLDCEFNPDVEPPNPGSAGEDRYCSEFVENTALQAGGSSLWISGGATVNALRTSFRGERAIDPESGREGPTGFHVESSATPRSFLGLFSSQTLYHDNGEDLARLVGTARMRAKLSTLADLGRVRAEDTSQLQLDQCVLWPSADTSAPGGGLVLAPGATAVGVENFGQVAGLPTATQTPGDPGLVMTYRGVARLVGSSTPVDATSVVAASLDLDLRPRPVGAVADGGANELR